jgi:DNA uptake protein ComE-like DNA-binding protein
MNAALARAEHLETQLRELEARVRLAEDRVLAAADAASESELTTNEAADRVISRLAKAEEAAGATAERLERLSAESAAARRALEELEKRPLAAAAATPPAAGGPEPAQALPAQPRASFEQLRAFGLSVNQTARLLAQREQRGGFSDLSQLDDLYGFPRDLIDRLQQSARL